MKLIKTKPGDLGDDPVWMILDSCFMYIDKSLIGVFWIYVTEYKDDKHMIG